MTSPSILQKLKGRFLWSSRKNSTLKIFVKLKKLSRQLKFVAKTRLCVVSLHYYVCLQRTFLISKLKKLSRHELKFVAKTRLCIFKLVRNQAFKGQAFCFEVLLAPQRDFSKIIVYKSASYFYETDLLFIPYFRQLVFGHFSCVIFFPFFSVLSILPCKIKTKIT